MNKFCKSNKKAFTLAEVLITLGIIGIVAEMVIPTMMQNVQVQVLKTMSKKEFSVLNQVLTMINVDKGSIKGACSDYNHKCLRDLFVPYMKSIKTCEAPNNTNCMVTCTNGWENGASVVLNDGTVMDFYAYDSNCTYTQGDLGQPACGEVAIDLNGTKKPNAWLSVNSTDETLNTTGDMLWLEITPTEVNWGHKNMMSAVFK